MSFMKSPFSMIKQSFKFFILPVALLVAGLLMSHCNIKPSEASLDEKNLKSETIVTGLTMPWAMAFLPDGRGLVHSGGQP